MLKQVGDIVAETNEIATCLLLRHRAVACGNRGGECLMLSWLQVQGDRAGNRISEAEAIPKVFQFGAEGVQGSHHRRDAGLQRLDVRPHSPIKQ
ncbi:MAG: hypothetical protein U1E70_00275 [Acetobacteraceae bacterium]